MASTRKSLRSTRSASSSYEDPIEQEGDRTAKRLKTQRRFVGAKTEEDIHSLLTSIFCTLVQGYWWKVLPDNDDDYDICLGTGQDWSKLLPLLLAGKYIDLPKRTVISKYSINRAALNRLCDSVNRASDNKLQPAT